MKRSGRNSGRDARHPSPRSAACHPTTTAWTAPYPANTWARYLPPSATGQLNTGCNVFHAGDGNLHPLILYDANKPGELERTEEFGGRILELCISVGGTITGEHGVGMEKINQMCTQFSEAELTQFHAVKQAFDPDGLLNPGKAIPTLARCAEFGRMHVHHGELPFPELDRF